MRAIGRDGQCTLSNRPDCKRALARNSRIVQRRLLIDSSDQYLNQLVCGPQKADTCNRTSWTVYNLDQLGCFSQDGGTERGAPAQSAAEFNLDCFETTGAMRIMGRHAAQGGVTP
jgi:hypothetical protein